MTADIYMHVLHVLTEIIASPSNVICNKCYDFKRRLNSSSHYVSLNTSFIKINISYFSDRASPSSVIICCTTMAILNVSLVTDHYLPAL
jgi:hypothetical protein